MAGRETSNFQRLDPENGFPITVPFSSADDILKWPEGFALANVGSVPVRRTSRTALDKHHPRTLFCHDMKGGYIDDRFVQGSTTDMCYRFFYWDTIDIFVYFSHHFITIPPPQWTNAAHENGVPVLGTVITEWTDGEKLCERFLMSTEKRQEFIAKLVSVCSSYKFDGWLLNVENKIPEDNVKHLIDFVGELTEAMHTELPGSLVIWYDSVITSGELKWQNELNSLNRPFFEKCDAIFLNYTWTDDNLVNSVEAAGDRIRDVYVGIDVFGRGCKGGGGFNTVEALTDVRNHKLSAAIFAPGWVHEVKGAEEFLNNEYNFWKLLQSRLYKHSLSEVPLSTTFCPGSGSKFYLDGNIIGHEPWTNLSLQALQPTGPQDGASLDSSLSFCGGACLKFQTQSSCERQNAELFSTNIELLPGQKVFVSYTFQGSGNSTVVLNLDCVTCPEAGKKNVKKLCFPSALLQHAELSDGMGNVVIFQTINETELDDIVCTNKFPGQNSDWRTVWFCLDPVEKMTIQSVSFGIHWDEADSQRACYLGSLRVFLKDNFKRPTVSKLTVCDATCVKISESDSDVFKSCITLKWECHDIADFFVVYQLDSEEWKFVGATRAEVFHMPEVISVDSLCQFNVVAVFCGGLFDNLDEASTVCVSLNEHMQNN